MNADVYADTAQGVVGTNMFAYCNNNPIAFIDPAGTNAITKEEHQPLDIFSYLLAIHYTMWLLVTGTYLEPVSISIPTFSRKTSIPSKLKNGDKVKTPDTHPDEFTKIGNKFRHKRTK